MTVSDVEPGELSGSLGMAIRKRRKTLGLRLADVVGAADVRCIHAGCEVL